MRLFIVRHGETFENKKHIHQGQLLGELNEIGKSEAEFVAEKLKNKNINFDHIFSSDLKRASDTSKIILKQFSNTPITFTTNLREGDWGSWTGLTHQETKGLVQPLDSETLKEIFIRAKKILLSTLAEFNDKTILFVGHNGINKAIISNVLNIPLSKFNQIRKQLNNDIYELEIDKNLKISKFLLNDSEFELFK